MTSCSFLGKVGEFLSACMASYHIRQCYLSDVSCRMFTAHILQTDRQKDESKQILYVSIKPAQTYVRKWVTVSKHESPNCCLRSDVSRYVLDIQRRYKQSYMYMYIYIYACYEHEVMASTAAQVGSNGKDYGLCSKGTYFESWSGHLLV